MVNVTIDGVRVSVEENTTIMDAAAAVGVRIPRLCYLKDINEIAACRVCLVEVDGHERLLTSCNNTVTEGMVIHTNSPRVRQARRTNVQLILSQHDCRCAVCVRSGNCSLQQLANDMGCIGNPYGENLLCVDHAVRGEEGRMHMAGHGQHGHRAGRGLRADHA